MTPTKLTLAVGSLVLQCLRRTVITQITTTALRRTAITHKLLPPPGPQTWGYITKIEAGGNEGNQTRNRQVFSEVYRVGVGRKEARQWKTVEGDSRGSDLGAGYTRQRDDSAKI